MSSYCSWRYTITPYTAIASAATLAMPSKTQVGLHPPRKTTGSQKTSPRPETTTHTRPARAALLTVERSFSFSVCLRRSGTVTSAAMRTLDPVRRTDEDTGRIDPALLWFDRGRPHKKQTGEKGRRWSRVKGQGSRVMGQVSRLPKQAIYTHRQKVDFSGGGIWPKGAVPDHIGNATRLLGYLSSANRFEAAAVKPVPDSWYAAQVLAAGCYMVTE